MAALSDHSLLSSDANSIDGERAEESRQLLLLSADEASESEGALSEDSGDSRHEEFLLNGTPEQLEQSANGADEREESAERAEERENPANLLSDDHEEQSEDEEGEPKAEDQSGTSDIVVNQTMNSSSASFDLGAIKRGLDISALTDRSSCPSCRKDRVPSTATRVRRVILDDSDFSVDNDDDESRRARASTSTTRRRAARTRTATFPASWWTTTRSPTRRRTRRRRRSRSRPTARSPASPPMRPATRTRARSSTGRTTTAGSWRTTRKKTRPLPFDHPSDQSDLHARPEKQLAHGSREARGRNQEEGDHGPQSRQTGRPSCTRSSTRRSSTESSRPTCGSIWQKRLLKTAAGRWDVQEHRIALSVKVLTGEGERLCSTLLHEMCHAAVSLIDKIRPERPHGPEFKRWAKLGMQKLHHQLQNVDRGHSYAIRYRFHYVCRSCSYTYKRHSKSIDMQKKRCGRCRGEFDLFVDGIKLLQAAAQSPVQPTIVEQEELPDISTQLGGLALD
ncbi:SprT-like domain-containing protein [Aphelenchoides fujianensis]|nr:SprT-like domain-containing protein [Aphelenchoides fujianensis]